MATQEPTVVEIEPAELTEPAGLTEPPAAAQGGAAPAGRRRIRRVLGWTGTGLAGLLVFAALAAPERLTQLTPKAFLRIPLEGLFLAALLLALGPRTRRVTA